MPALVFDPERSLSLSDLGVEDRSKGGRGAPGTNGPVYVFDQSAVYLLVLTTWRRSFQKQVVDKIHHVGNVNRPVAIHVSILKGVRRRAATEQVIDQIYHV
jgi:uncharacterized protein YhbP (UPF0306 family)